MAAARRSAPQSEATGGESEAAGGEAPADPMRAARTRLAGQTIVGPDPTTMKPVARALGAPDLLAARARAGRLIVVCADGRKRDLGDFG